MFKINEGLDMSFDGLMLLCEVTFKTVKLIFLESQVAADAIVL